MTFHDAPEMDLSLLYVTDKRERSRKAEQKESGEVINRRPFSETSSLLECKETSTCGFAGETEKETLPPDSPACLQVELLTELIREKTTPSILRHGFYSSSSQVPESLTEPSETDD